MASYDYDMLQGLIVTTIQHDRLAEAAAYRRTLPEAGSTRRHGTTSLARWLQTGLALLASTVIRTVSS